MGKGTVRVVGRTRPTDFFANEAIKLQEDEKTVHIHYPRRRAGEESSANEVINNAIEDHTYRLDLFLKDASQDTVFELCALDVVKAVMQGYNGTVMCYGQTGAGKTYTMMGGSDYRTRGVIPRAVKAIFDEVSTHADKTYDISVTFVEVYNERIYDLLDPGSTEDIAIQEDSKGTVTVRGVANKSCRQEAEALAYLFEGNTNRVTAEHAMNKNSSRSHTIFTIHVTSRSRVESESASLVSKMHCIDLAGSERLSKSGSTEGKLIREAQFINKSLTFLEQVVMALSSSARSHVPFRQSKLTNLLKDSLGGNSKTTMIANLWPEERHMEETISTLKFAARMMKVQTDAAVNVMVDPATQIKQLQRQIADLKAELQMQNQLVGKSHIVYEGEIGPDERYEMEKVVRSYVQGQQPDIPVRSLREVKEYFRIFKGFVDSREAEAKAAAPLATETPSFKAPSAVERVGTVRKLQTEQQPQDVGVGAVDPSAGVSIGVAAPAKNLKEIQRAPLSPPKASAQPVEEASPTRGVERIDNAADSGSGLAPAVREMPEKAAAFEDFKATEGLRLVAALKDATAQLQVKRKRAAELSAKVNEIKVQIDSFAFQLEQRRLDRQARGEDEIVDDEEFEIVRLVKDKKGEYRAAYDQLSSVKADRDHLGKTVEHAKQKLLGEFETWFDHTFGQQQPQQQQQTRVSLKALRQSAGGGALSLGAVDDDDVLDEGERFEMLELNRVMNEDPDSVAFYNAKKITQAKQSGKPRTVVRPPKRR